MHPETDDHPARLEDVARALGLRVDEVLRRTDKTLLAGGRWRDRPVVIKLLLDTEPFWIDKLQHEIAIYQVLGQHRPPVRVPALLYTDGRRLLVLERLPGVPLDRDRLPEHAVAPAALAATLQTLGALAAWQQPTHAFRRVFDYADRVARYSTYGLLDDSDRRALTALIDRCADRWQLNHGDPLPSNLIYDGVQCGLIDWEFTGLYLPGFDLALLRILLLRTPQAAAEIDRAVAVQDIETPFAVNLAMALTRELRLHRELPDTHPHRSRLPLIAAAWEEARRSIHTLAGATDAHRPGPPRPAPREPPRVRWRR